MAELLLILYCYEMDFMLYLSTEHQDGEITDFGFNIVNILF